MSDIVVPDLTEFIVGYRGWNLRGADNDVLLAVTGHCEWRQGRNVARCDPELLSRLVRFRSITGAPASGHPEGEPCPARGCMCGLYAYHRPLDVTQGAVQGVVRAWGAIEVHTAGFRAQYAEVCAIWTGIFHDDSLRPAAERYGVPVISALGAQAFAAECGSPVPLSLRPTVQQRVSHGLRGGS